MQGYGVYWVKLRLYAVGKSRFKSFVELNSNLLKWIPSPPRYEKVRVPILTFSSFHVSCCITSKKRMARPETRWLLPNKSPSSIISQSRAAIGTLHSSSLQSTISRLVYPKYTFKGYFKFTDMTISISVDKFRVFFQKD